MKAFIYAAALVLSGVVLAPATVAAVPAASTQANAPAATQTVAAAEVPADSEVGALLGYTTAVQLHLQQERHRHLSVG